MKSIKKIVHGQNWFRCPRGCALCKDLLWRDLWCCEDCEQKLRSHFCPVSPQLTPMGPLHHLWTWGKASPPELATLLRSLKNTPPNDPAARTQSGRPPPAMALNPWLDELVHRLSLHLHHRNWVIVPAPSHRPEVADHAYMIGQQLAQRLGIPFENNLARSVQLKTGETQKSRSLAERKKIRFRRKRGKKLKSVIFVDDIFTSGSTAKSAYLALGRPLYFQIAVLAYREKSSDLVFNQGFKV